MNQESTMPRRLSAAADASAVISAFVSTVLGTRAAVMSLALTAVAVAGCLAAAPPQPSAPAPALSSAPASAAAEPVPAPVPVVAMAERASRDPAAGNNLLWNGTFEDDAVRPWSLVFDSARNGRRVPAQGELCLRIDSGGSHAFDVVLRQSPLGIVRGHHYELRFRTHATGPTRLRAKVAGVGTRAATYWAGEATSGAEAKTFAAPFEAIADDEAGELTIELGGELTGAVPLTVCLDDLALSDPQFEVPAERTARKPLPRVRVNQLGYLPGFAKIATVATAETMPQGWELIDAAGKVHAAGKTRLFGEDRSSGEQVQQIDFSSVTTPGKGWKLRVGKAESFPFTIGDDVYGRLKYDALSFFYLQRSGTPIKMPYAGAPAYERPAGHPGDKSVPCAPLAKCTYSLDVSGGWYDAGDHGKYVVNSAISVWTLQNQYEALGRFGATAGDFDDGKMNLPEAGNGRPDLLDEARYNLEFMLKMQVPEGQPHAGMAHQRIHGEKWSDLPTRPDKDTIRRFLRPVSTGATYDLAATAAQGARLWRKLDPAFSARCLKAAETAFAAAKKSPIIYAEPMGVGGGAYGDGDLSDELYWAATELFVTTGSGTYKDEMTRSRFHASKAPEAAGGNLGWDHVAALAKISLSEVPNTLGEAAIAEQRQALVAVADRLLGFIEKRGYRAPASSDSAYIWGSNAGVMNGALVLGTAYFFTHDRKYANGVIDCMDYLLGRNPLAKSYVAGYGSNPLRNPHHRVWAHQKDASLPEAPRGAVSGGPNSMLQDPYIRKLGMSGCPPQTCYVDHIESYSTNEVAINWNAPLAWDAAFLDDLAHRH